MSMAYNELAIDMHIVYKHTNRQNGKAYVGFTPKVTISGATAEELLQWRWQGHCSDALERGSDLIFHKAIRKHGLDAFDHEVLETCPTLAEVLKREVHWIAELHTSVDEGGYNMTRGGEGNLMSESVKERHRQATSQGTRKARLRPEVRENHRRAMQEMCARSDIKEQRSKNSKEVASRPDVKAKRSVAALKMWSNPTMREHLCVTHVGTRNGRAKMTETDVRAIREAWSVELPSGRGPVGQFYRRFAERLGVTSDMVCRIVLRKAWKHIA